MAGAGVCTRAVAVAASTRIASPRDIDAVPVQHGIAASIEAEGDASGQQSASHVAPRPAKSMAKAASTSRPARFRLDVPFMLMSLQTRNIPVHYAISCMGVRVMKKSTNPVILSREDGEGSRNATTEATGGGRRILRSFASLRMTGLAKDLSPRNGRRPFAVFDSG
jgi:hypothetical protein